LFIYPRINFHPDADGPALMMSFLEPSKSKLMPTAKELRFFVNAAEGISDMVFSMKASQKKTPVTASIRSLLTLFRRLQKRGMAKRFLLQAASGEWSIYSKICLESLPLQLVIPEEKWPTRLTRRCTATALVMRKR